MQAEEVAGVHFLEDAVQLGRLVVQEAQRRHCSDKRTTDTHIQPKHISSFFIQGEFKRKMSLAFYCQQPPAKNTSTLLSHTEYIGPSTK